MADTNPRDDDDDESYPEEHDGARLLGTSAEGGVAYYHPDDRLLLETDLGPTELRDDPSGWVNRRELAPGESLSDLVDSIDRSIGFTEMSEYARSHLPGMSATGDEESESATNDGTDRS
ncbi:hypothetical protein [Halogranum rubrum]|uniref:Uncharacterized protein n=1 Tax=Halogranum salarium B-1 TaxID=1210908 RepID=J3A333_9EURY|nr:hypothetical protein [Halogranum salarium]EJN59738.1 hypothetical protein HSB1_18960 [Halogranum salarium B-1]